MAAPARCNKVQAPCETWRLMLPAEGEKQAEAATGRMGVCTVLRKGKEEELRREKRRRSRRWRWTIRQRNQYEVLADNADFQKLYRLTPELFEDLCREIAPLLPEPRRSDGISKAKKIMTTLAFFASGSYQRLVGSNVDSCIAQQTVSCVIREVAAALNDPRILNKYIHFPWNQREREEIKHGFFQKFGMPGVVGCVDCTHVALIRPRAHEERYFNRKYYHSLNVQVICDANMRIIDVDARYGGATHDSFIFHQSVVKRHLEQLQENTWLLGDAGYPLRKYVMTPISNAAENTPEGYFNTIQKTTRNTIERTFGVLKGRWRCLLAARELHYDPVRAGRIVNACCVLHNFCIAHPALAAPQLSARERRIERFLQERRNVLVVLRRAAAAELQVGQQTRTNLVRALRRV